MPRDDTADADADVDADVDAGADVDAAVVHGVPVYGVDVDGETRCAHYDSDVDVVALRFACCGDYYPCVECHDARADHDRAVWPASEFDAVAVLCGVCGTEHRIADYLAGGDECVACGAAFNPGCADHYHYYFDVSAPGKDSV